MSDPNTLISSPATVSARARRSFKALTDKGVFFIICRLISPMMENQMEKNMDKSNGNCDYAEIKASVNNMYLVGCTDHKDSKVLGSVLGSPCLWTLPLERNIFVASLRIMSQLGVG